MPEELTWTNPVSGGLIVIQNNVTEMLNRSRQVAPASKESGGILLGARRGPHLEITDLTTPFPKDIRRRTFFDRCDPKHHRYALRQWKNNGQKIGYLGEWHTHPENKPSPSHLDTREWMSVIDSQKPHLIFVIVGISGIWLGLGTQSGITRCNIFLSDDAPDLSNPWIHSGSRTTRG